MCIYTRTHIYVHVCVMCSISIFFFNLRLCLLRSPKNVPLKYFTIKWIFFFLALEVFWGLETLTFSICPHIIQKPYMGTQKTLLTARVWDKMHSMIRESFLYCNYFLWLPSKWYVNFDDSGWYFHLAVINLFLFNQSDIFFNTSFKK